ncbi:AAA family ATPase [Bradyrhizobium sp.]|uniref:bifunctional DNA primase/polymerase n=1 Tax=Bradyrhizobium sp. TaxID=376 RepID=UPI002717E05D|nr:AAA family ATPase [Bradyrhizobium sp.]MDO9295587.1 AAA family ATPase [Bradyrhizobium sp.]
MIDTTGLRRNANKVHAIALAKIGVAVFPSSGKVPLIPRFNQLDTTISSEDREAAAAKFREKNDGKDPIHVGATKDPETVKRMWRAHRDAVPSIACGPSGLVVLDADQKDNGPELMDALFEQNGGVPAGAPVLPTKSGGKHFVFADPDGTYTNRAGLLKKNYGADVRGTGGQFVAPGSIREDGKTYGTEKDLAAFCRAIANKTIPMLPGYVSELIGTTPEGEPSLGDSDPVVRSLMVQLGAENWPDFELTFDSSLGRFCLECIRERAPEFGDLYDRPTDDRSQNRFMACRYLVAAFPDMTVTEYAAFLEAWDGSGEYDHRQIAREFAKAKRKPMSIPSNGAAFGAVEDDEENELKAVQSSRKPARFVFLEDIRGATLRLLDWCIKYFIARGTTSIVSGQWGAGKTAVFVDIGLHIAHGLSYRGRKVKKSVCVYVALENAEDVERRVRTWCESMTQAGNELSDGGAFVVHRGPCRLFDPSGKATRDEKELIEIAKRASKHYGLPVGMVIVDTLSQALSPGDEHRDGAKFTAALHRIANATGANVTALHHPTKAGQDVRGDGAFQGNVDTIIVVSRDSAGKGTIAAGSKFRIGNPAKVKFGYRLKSFVIGRDDDGDDIEVVLAVEPAAPDLSVTDDDDDEAVTLAPSDRREDRIQAVIDVFDREAERQKADDESLPAARKRLEMQSGEIERAVHARRRTDGLKALGRSTVQDHIRAAVEAGRLEAVGTKARPLYRLG